MQTPMKTYILRLKQVRIEKGVTYEEIVSGVEKNGDSVSLSTVRKIFADGSEDEISVKWSTIQPVGYFLLGIDETESYNPANARMYFEQIDALKTAVSHAEKENSMLEDLIKEKTKAIAHFQKQIKYYRIYICITIVIVLALTYLLIDANLPNMGFFRG